MKLLSLHFKRHKLLTVVDEYLYFRFVITFSDMTFVIVIKC